MIMSYTPKIKDSATFAFNRDKYSNIYGFRACEVDLPYVEYDIEKGEKLLVILAYATEEDTRAKKLGNSSQGLLVKKIVEQVSMEIDEGVRTTLPSIKTVSLINFRDKDNERLMDADQRIESNLYKKWVDRLVDYIDSYQPTRILISGEIPYRAIRYHSQTHLSDHDNLDAVEYREPFLQVGRVFPFIYNGKEIPTSFTLPFHWTATSNPKYIEEAPNLIHQQKFHLEYLLFGKNMYTVTDNKLWSHTDIMTMELFDAFYEKLINAPKVCIDIETVNLARLANKILTMHFSLDGLSAYNLPLCHKDTPFTADEIHLIQAKLKAYFEDGKSAEHVFHNAKFDIGVMYGQFNLAFYNHKVFDTISGIFSLDENTRYYTSLRVSTYNLRHLAYQYGCSVYDEGEIRKEDRSRMAELDLMDIFAYAAKDVIIPYQVSEFQVQEAGRRGYILWKDFITEQLGAMILVFVSMENKGILVDLKYLIDLCSNEGVVKKLLDEVLAKFKKSDSAKEVNEILVIQKRILASLQNYKRAFRKDKSTLGKVIKVLNKPVRILKKDQSDLDFVNATIAKQDTDSGYAATLQQAISLYEEFNKILAELEKRFAGNIQEMKLYDNVIKDYSLIDKLDSLKSIFISAKEVEAVKELQDKVSSALVDLESLKQFRMRPVDLSTEWLFDISKQATQQLLFFSVLRLKPTNKRKDGGGTTGKDFQVQYQDIEEVALLDKYTKYKKLMSTYILGMMKRLEGDADSQLDGKLRAEYGFRDVLTGRCLRGDVLVTTDQGDLSIEKIVNEKINCNVLTHTGTWQPVTDWIESGNKEVFEVTLESGKVLFCTACHPLLTEEGWVELKDLKVDDKITSL